MLTDTKTALLASNIIATVTRNGFSSTAGLAKYFNVSRSDVIDTYDVIEAAGYRLNRQRGSIGGGIEIVGRPRAVRSARKAA